MTMNDSRPTVSHTGFRTKVMDYITTMQVEYPELLVFGHVGSPEAGIQIPAGTLEETESPREEVLSEVFEETGLNAFYENIFLGSHLYWYSSSHTLILRYAYLLLSQETRNQWIHVVAGEDSQMEFMLYWIPLSKTLHLQGDFGSYFHRVRHSLHDKYLLQRGN